MIVNNLMIASYYSLSSINATMSFKFQGLLVTPASIAGETLKELWIRTKL